MILDYIYHSGFAIEAEGVTLIIDYYKDSSETELNKGIVHDRLLQRPGKLYVLASHFHPDHFNREVLTWKEQRPDIIYIFSKDILKHHRAQKEDAIYINKGEEYEDDMLRIQAFGSTDVGISFLIHLQGKSIFLFILSSNSFGRPTGDCRPFLFFHGCGREGRKNQCDLMVM